MTGKAQRLAAVGALNAAIAIAAGAFGAHALKQHLGADQLATFEVGVRYQMYNALGMIAVALLVTSGRARSTWPGWAMQVGIVLFTGSLVGLATTGAKVFGAFTPLGGAAFLVGWIGLAVGLRRERS